MKNVFQKHLTRMELFYALVVVGFVMWLFSPRGHGSYRNRERSYCQSNLKQIGLAFAQYAQDSNDRFPALSNNLGWKGLISPYLKSEAVFQCPSIQNENPTDYWFNRRLNGQKLENVAEVAQTLLAGDGNDGTDAVSPDYNYSDLPAKWRVDEKSPAWRHLEVANYLFVDGHVKALKVARVKTRVKPTEREAQFALD